MATPEQINELTEKMTAERSRLLEQVRRLDDATASAVPVGKTGEEQWTVKEQLAHLCEMELGYDSWVEAALEGDNPNVGDITPRPVAIPIEHANAHGVAELVQVMEGERRDTLALIARMSPDDFERPATHPMFGTLTSMQWLRSFYRHDRMHADQIAGREPEYKPQFATAEPNQRAARLARVARESAPS
jgi:hypothetical protein